MPPRKNTSDGSRVRYASSSAPSAQVSRKKMGKPKSITCRHTEFENYLAKKHGSHMKEHKKGITMASKNLCRILLETMQDLPSGPSPSHGLSNNAYESDHDRNEASVIRRTCDRVVPSTELLLGQGTKSLPADLVSSLFSNEYDSSVNRETATFSADRTESLEYLAQTVDVAWRMSIPLINTQPKPDYAVGIRASHFTDEQCDKLQPALGDVLDPSFFKTTGSMYFPFFACEIKSGKSGSTLNVANRQNFHSMTLAARAVVELFRLSGRQRELDRNILAFSISHDDSFAAIFGHYPAFHGDKVRYYHHLIARFAFASPTGEDKYTAYRFTKNVYEIFAPLHRQRILSAIDSIVPAEETLISSQASGHTERSRGTETGHGLTPRRSLKRHRSRNDMDRSPRFVSRIRLTRNDR